MEVLTDAPGDIPPFFTANGASCGTSTALSSHTSFTLDESVNRVVSVSDNIAELAVDVSTMETRSEGNWEGFAPVTAETTLVGTITVTPEQEDDLMNYA